MCEEGGSCLHMGGVAVADIDTAASFGPTCVSPGDGVILMSFPPLCSALLYGSPPPRTRTGQRNTLTALV